MQQVQVKVFQKVLTCSVDSAEITEEVARDVIQKIKQELEGNPQAKSVICAWSGVMIFPIAGQRIIARYFSILTSQEFKCALVVPNSIKELVKSNGLSNLLPCYLTLEEIPFRKSQEGGGNALEFLNTIIDSITETLQNFTGIVAKPGKPVVSKSGLSDFTFDIGAVAGIVSDTFTGSFILAFPMPIYLKVMSGLMSQEFAEFDPDISDGAAELLNMVFGQAKKSLNEKGFGLKPTIPTVFIGKEVKILNLSNATVITVPFETSLGSFCASFSTVPVK